ncbi:hypothetical protein EYF80_025302 [Liparis tanakae]|uniref:Secreted protein n=1 Tax=Liparis tanakae TaxID=230148 RepID=A0A4Z2HFS8_9TELE|nr:hypothetical protein EYF80_025302 [Liparis tanakae]
MRPLRTVHLLLCLVCGDRCRPRCGDSAVRDPAQRRRARVPGSPFFPFARSQLVPRARASLNGSLARSGDARFLEVVRW